MGYLPRDSLVIITKHEIGARERTMAIVEIQVPKDLGLSDDQVSQLRDMFVSQLVESLNAEEGEAIAPRPKVVVKGDAVVIDVKTA